MKVVVAGGGTAGHVNPAIAVARAMPGSEVSFVGTERGVESRLVSAAGFELDTIEVAGLDRARPWAAPAVAFRAAGAVAQARRVLAARRPDAVLGMGGYVSLPVALAAASRRIPVVLHEQNIVLGLANRVGKRLARTVAVSFEETLAAVGPKGVLTGNPVNPEMANFDRPGERERGLDRFGLDPGRATLLVFGGSLGARSINVAAAGLPDHWRERSDLQLLHITGSRSPDAPEARPAGELLVRAVPYVERMAEAYAVADLALCRGGATTVAELTAAGLPSLIVPYPYHRDRQQERHGRVLEGAGAAIVIPDADLDPARLAADAGRLLGDRSRLASMADAARSLARPHAAAEVAALLEGVA